jgi:hypothetical protein
VPTGLELLDTAGLVELVPAPLRLAPDDGEADARALLLDSAPVEVPAEPLKPAAPVEVPALEGEVPAVSAAPDTPEHGATAADVNGVELVDEISTPATLQFCGICCSMISTKLIGPVVVLVVVVLPVAEVLAPTAEALAPAAGEALSVVVVPVEVPALGAMRMSMKATVWPLLLRFRKVPSIGIVEPELVPDTLLPLVAPDALAKVPVHWFWVSICW